MIAFLILETLMIGVFCALDIVLFYVFFEAGLIPMFLIIGVWGGERRVYASFIQVFLYTLLGSVLMLLAIMAMYWQMRERYGHRHCPTKLVESAIRISSGRHADLAVAGLLRLLRRQDADVAGPHLACRMPMSRHRPPVRSFLAAVLLKMGGYGFLRFSLPMFPARVGIFRTLRLCAVQSIAIVYTSLVALMQEDMKKLIAYSSVAHMGFVTMGIFTVDDQQGIDGAIFQMISHGFISGRACSCAWALIYDRIHTRARSMPMAGW